MSKYDELLAKLDRLESKSRDLTTELECVADEIQNVKTMLEIIEEVLSEKRSAEEEALATLITKRDDRGRITDSDFLEFGSVTGLDLSGLIEMPEPENDQEKVAQVA